MIEKVYSIFTEYNFSRSEESSKIEKLKYSYSTKECNFFVNLSDIDKVYPGGFFLRAKILCYEQNFQWVQTSVFTDGKFIFPNLFA